MFTHRRPGTKSHVGFFYSDFRWFFQHPCLLSCTDLFRWRCGASRMTTPETQVKEMTGDWKRSGGKSRFAWKNTAYNLQIYIEIMDSQKVKFVNCKLMTWERIVSYSLHITIYKFVNIMDSLIGHFLDLSLASSHSHLRLSPPSSCPLVVRTCRPWPVYP